MKTTSITYEDLIAQILVDDKNILILGPAGYGKSFLIKSIQVKNEHTQEERDNKLSKALYSAPSGIAARNINGVTLHSLFEMVPVNPQPQHIDKPIPGAKAELLKKASHLVIDEISMVRCDILDKIDLILREVRENDKPFGDIRLIMIGDPFQLQPIPPKDKKIMKKFYPKLENYAFHNSKIFQDETFRSSLKIYNLEHDFRHENDNKFSNILSSLRLGNFSDETSKFINSRVDLNVEDGECIRLATTNDIANHLNANEIKKLQDQEDKSEIVKEIFNKAILLDPDMYPMKETLIIKRGMKIIFVVNDKNKRWVNGTFGTITDKYYGERKLESVFISVGEEEYIVKKEWYDIYYPFYNKEKNVILPEKIASVYQFPFIAAWAITIHRSQSLTLDKARLELGARLFADGQLYVGISRVRNIKDLTLNRPIKKSDISIQPETTIFYNEFLLPNMKRVVKETDPLTEYIENLEILMANSVANDFKGNVDFSESELDEFKADLSTEKDNFFKTFVNDEKHDDAESNTEKQKVKDHTEIVNTNVSVINKRKNAPEGIDKIKIILNPYFVNYDSHKKHISPHNKITLHQEGLFRMVSIHAEYLYSKNDIQISLARAIYELIEYDILCLDFLKSYSKDKAIYFIYTNLSQFIICVSEIEFFFNLKNKKIAVKEEAVAYKYLIPCGNYKKGAVSYYTCDVKRDYSRHSIGIIYNKMEKLKKDNQTPYKVLSSNPYETRLELKLFNKVSDWMHLDNLKGNYKTIIKNYLEYLAILYKIYFLEYIDIDTSENKYLSKIETIAKTTDKVRYTNKKNTLKKQDPVSTIFLSKPEIEEQKRKIEKLANAFFEQIEYFENDKNYDDFVNLLGKM